MDPSCTSDLCESLKQWESLVLDGHHEVSKLIDNHVQVRAVVLFDLTSGHVGEPAFGLVHCPGQGTDDIRMGVSVLCTVGEIPVLRKLHLLRIDQHELRLER